MGYSIFENTIVDMPWPSLEKAIQDGAIALLPTCVIEEHGPHLSLGTDTYTAWLLCKRTCQHLESDGIKTIIAPPCYWGINQATGGFPGSFTIREDTFKALLLDIYACLHIWGVKHIFTIDGHGDPVHERVIFDAAKDAREMLGINAYVLLDDYKAEISGLTGKEAHIVIARTPALNGPMPQFAEVHAGAIETGMMIEYFPDTVDLESVKTLSPTQLTYSDVPRWQQGGATAREMTPLGYFGAPADYKRDLEEIQKYYDALPGMYAEAIANVIKNKTNEKR